MVGSQDYRVQFVLLPAGHPKRVRQLIHELETPPSNGLNPETYTVLAAPWFSPETVALCAEQGYGTLDLSGNYRLHFGSLFLERVGEAPPRAVRRQTASLFAPKSARIVRALLAVPGTDWKVTELADVTDVSLGLVSRVRRELLERGWAEERPDGIRLSAYKPLLNAWAEYRQEAKDPPWLGYTLLHGKKLNEVLQDLQRGSGGGENVVLAGPSAAQWMAPFLRDERQYFYATPNGFQQLCEELDLESEPTGNIVVRVTEEPEVFLDRVQAAPGVWTTSPAQTFLDLHLEGERGQEAAKHLLQHYLQPIFEGRAITPASPISTRLAFRWGQR
ncbi:MarR family transcriptional regulator [Deinococcus saxicola]|uniref:hypothetical protein n=1 Tax=Deinococcus saxicola TaxID=249406 RepID=UPI0039F00FB5